MKGNILFCWILLIFGLALIVSSTIINFEEMSMSLPLGAMGSLLFVVSGMGLLDTQTKRGNEDD